VKNRDGIQCGRRGVMGTATSPYLLGQVERYREQADRPVRGT
jgi:hypothetical protein